MSGQRAVAPESESIRVAGPGRRITRPATDADRSTFLRYTRPERWPVLDRFPVSEALSERLLAEILDCDADAVAAGLAGLDAEAARSAAAMLAEPGVQDRVRGLQAMPRSRLVAVGDSLTADRLGWFAMLEHALRLTGASDVHTHNLGLSGATSADALERFDLIEAAEPTHVLILLGTNDVRRHGRSQHHRMLSGAESARNLRALVDMCVGDLGATVTLLTPPPADESLSAMFFRDSPVHWRAGEVDEVADAVRSTCTATLGAGALVDVHAALTEHGTAGLLEPDGVHLTPAGQRRVLDQVLSSLASAAERVA